MAQLAEFDWDSRHVTHDAFGPLVSLDPQWGFFLKKLTVSL